MSQSRSPSRSKKRKSARLTETGDTRLGDLSSFLEALRPLQAVMTDSETASQRLIADYIRLVGGMSPLQFKPVPGPNAELIADLMSPAMIDPSVGKLSRRQKQTLQRLLEGDSEKQVAQKLELSKHTVHVYVKSLYRHFGVSSRGELMSRHVKR